MSIGRLVSEKDANTLYPDEELLITIRLQTSQI
jgi:hypothetical protein